MTILIKAATGLVAGLVAGALGLAFLPHAEPNAVKPRAAVEKPQFVAAAANVKTTTAPAPSATQSVAVASEAQNEQKRTDGPQGAAEQLVHKAPPSSPTPNPDVKPPPQAAVAPNPGVGTAKVETPKAAPIAVAKADPPKAALIALAKAEPPTPTPSGKPIALAEMSPPAPPSSAIAKSAPEPAKPEVAASAESASWSVRGLVAFAKGDLSSARLYLARAAELGDPRALVALADTYDPAVLAKLGVVCAPGDAQRAKDYLVKAAAAGVVSAKDRMAALDQAAH